MARKRYGKIEEELENLIINPAKASTKEYYEEWKNMSYPLNLESDKRGRAIIFTMTENRPGWEEDVKSLYKMLKSINMDVELVNDPDHSKIVNSLEAFVEHRENLLIDMCFVIFMGHGFASKDSTQDVYIKIKKGVFNVWPETVNIFRKETSLLKDKPKVFIVQACGSVHNVPVKSPAIAPATPASFLDYIFLYACQPGMVADRENHFFIKSLTDMITENAHVTNLSDLIGTRLSMKFKNHQNDPKVKEQRPQICQSLSRFLNIFPGITKDSVKPEKKHNQKKYTQQRCNICRRITTSVCPFLEICLKLNSGKTYSDRTRVERGDCFRSSAEIGGVDGIQDRPFETERSTDMISRCRAILQIQIRVRQNSDLNVQAAIEAIFTRVKQEKHSIEELLTSECESYISVDDITKGSILLHITCDMEALEPLHYLSVTGLLSSKFSSLLITKSCLEMCKVSEMKLDVQLKVSNEDVLKQLNPVVYNLPIVLTYLRKPVVLKAPFEIVGGKWFCSGAPITTDNRITIRDGNICELEVKYADVSDTGDYCLKCTTADGFPVEVRVTVLVMNQSAPSNVKAKVDNKQIVLSWDPAIGKVTGYNIQYLTESCTSDVKILVVSNTTHATITDVLPGETYKVYIRSVSEDGMSDPEPPEGLTVHTKPETPAGHPQAVSDPEPPEGLTVHTPPETPAGHSQAVSDPEPPEGLTVHTPPETPAGHPQAVSDPEPPEGLTVHTPLETPAGHPQAVSDPEPPEGLTVHTQPETPVMQANQENVPHRAVRQQGMLTRFLGLIASFFSFRRPSTPPPSDIL